MAVEADVIYKDKLAIVTSMVQSLLVRIPGAWVEEDGNIRLLFEIIAGEHEGVYLANQLLRDNIWVQRANITELRLHGEQFGLPVKAGTLASGLLRFSGAAGTTIPAGSEVAADVGEADVLYFVTVGDATIPSPGVPNAPVIADAVVAGTLVAGAYNYAVTFTTAEGETVAGVTSNTITLASSSKMNLTAIPIGGPGTLTRKIYRSVNGGDFKYVATIADNTTTTYLDNIAPGSLGGLPPATSTAEQITVNANAELAGLMYNLGVGTIIIGTNVPSGVLSVTNTTTMTGGTDEEDMETFRQRLLGFIRAPRTGSKLDIKAWSEEIDGVESATVFANDNLGTAQNGHVTVRLAGPNGSIPSAGVIAAVQLALDTKDIANMTIHVTTFTANPVAVTVALTLTTGFVLSAVSPSVVNAITQYINSRPVGGTVYTAGIYDAVYGLPGIDTLVVSAPTAPGATSTSVQKATAGTITVT